jgi:hypothetical protein
VLVVVAAVDGFDSLFEPLSPDEDVDAGASDLVSDFDGVPPLVDVSPAVEPERESVR